MHEDYRQIQWNIWPNMGESAPQFLSLVLPSLYTLAPILDPEVQ